MKWKYVIVLWHWPIGESDYHPRGTTRKIEETLYRLDTLRASYVTHERRYGNEEVFLALLLGSP